MEDITCECCKKLIISAPLRLSEGKYYCYNCSGATPCQNSFKGCTFTTNNEFLLRKHEYWICNYNASNCPKCEKKLTKSRLLHYEETHDRKKETCRKNNIVKAEFTSPFEKNLSYIIVAHDVKFRLSFFFLETVLNIVLTGYENRMSSRQFECTYKITYGDRFIEGRLEPLRRENFGTYQLVTDWQVTIYRTHSHINNVQDKRRVFELCIIKNV